MPTPSRPPLDVLQRARERIAMYPEHNPGADIEVLRDLLALVLDNPHRQVLERISSSSFNSTRTRGIARQALRDADAQVKP